MSINVQLATHGRALGQREWESEHAWMMVIGSSNFKVVDELYFEAENF